MRPPAGSSHPELRRFATGLVGRSDAADVVSNAMVKALAAPAWPAVSNRRAYLYRAVMNEARTWSHRRAQRQAREQQSGRAATWELVAVTLTPGDTAHRGVDPDVRPRPRLGGDVGPLECRPRVRITDLIRGAREARGEVARAAHSLRPVIGFSAEFRRR